MRQNFVQLIQEGNEFETLDIEDVVDILQDDELNVKNEELVYFAVQKWVEANPYKYRPYLLDLLKCVRFGTLSYDFVCRVLRWKPVKENPVSIAFKFYFVDVNYIIAALSRIFKTGVEFNRKSHPRN